MSLSKKSSVPLSASLLMPVRKGKRKLAQTGKFSPLSPPFFVRTKTFFPLRPSERRMAPRRAVGEDEGHESLALYLSFFSSSSKAKRRALSRKGDRKKKVRKILLAFPFLSFFCRNVNYCPLRQNKKAVAQLIGGIPIRGSRDGCVRTSMLMQYFLIGRAELVA